MDTRASCYGVEVGRSREPWKFEERERRKEEEGEKEKKVSP